VAENADSLRISSTYLKRQSLTFLQNDLRWPDLHINSVYLAGNHGLDIRGEIVSVRTPRAVTWVVMVDLPKTNSLPAFANWHWVTD
jgi:hypothetical protein